jgi:hypothetical protein
MAGLASSIAGRGISRLSGVSVAVAGPRGSSIAGVGGLAVALDSGGRAGSGLGGGELRTSLGGEGAGALDAGSAGTVASSTGNTARDGGTQVRLAPSAAQPTARCSTEDERSGIIQGAMGGRMRRCPFVGCRMPAVYNGRRSRFNRRSRPA